jgi:hypothetical protein
MTMFGLQMRMFAGLIAVAIAGMPLGAFAQGAPANVPSYAAPGPAQASDQETIHGHIASIDDADSLQINDDRGFVDNVKLQQGTIIAPSGSQLQPGMTVTITGVNRGSVFAANRIDISDGAGAPPQQQQRQLAPPPPAQQQQQGPASFEQPAPGADAVQNTDLSGILGSALDSKSAFVGEAVTLRDVTSFDGTIRGAKLYGSVTDVTRPGQGRNAQVAIHFDKLRLNDGSTKQIDGIVVSMKVNTKNNAAKEIGGAFLGMLAGNAIGKTLFGIGGGGIVGAIGGYMIAKDNRSDVVIPENTDVTVRVVNPRRQAN